MREDAVTLEDGRLEGLDLDNYPWIYERHRIFPDVFKNEKYDKILDIAAGMGVVAKRIHDRYPCFMVCNDITPTCLKSLRSNGFNTVSFDLDDPDAKFPFPDETFDAVLSLATLEHILNLEHHMNEIKRILKKGGHLYISVPNYSGLAFMLKFFFTGRTFHNPLGNPLQRYEFLAHIRYFTYKTLLDYIRSYGFKSDKVYLPLPKSSSRYIRLRKKLPPLALLFKFIMFLLYRFLPPRWALHPVLRFSNMDVSDGGIDKKPKKVIL
jgi:SAM-dependent methyltransferase